MRTEIQLLGKGARQECHLEHKLETDFHLREWIFWRALKAVCDRRVHHLIPSEK